MTESVYILAGHFLYFVHLACRFRDLVTSCLGTREHLWALLISVFFRIQVITLTVSCQNYSTKQKSLTPSSEIRTEVCHDSENSFSMKQNQTEVVDHRNRIPTAAATKQRTKWQEPSNSLFFQKNLDCTIISKILPPKFSRPSTAISKPNYYEIITFSMFVAPQAIFFCFLQLIIRFSLGF